MKFIILKENLKNALSAVERVVTENNNLPILRNVLLKADSHIKVAATNLEIGVTCLTAGKITENGSLTIPFAPLYNIISGSDSERINIITDKNTLIIKTDNYEAKIQGVNEEEFPIIPKIENNNHYFEIEGQVFKESIQQIISAAQFSEIKPELSGVLFDFQVTALKLVATDSFRLAEKILLQNSFKTTIPKGCKIIIPLKTIQEVVRIFPNSEKIKIYIDPHQILFQTDSLQLISRLIDGTYPDYQSIIPKTIETELVMDKEQFVTGIKLVSNFSGKTSDIRLKIPKDNKVLEIYSANQYLGENNYLIPAKKKGEGFTEVSFNWRYLTDGLKSVFTKQVVFGVNGDTKPAILKPVEDESVLYIVMPTKTS